MTTMERIDVYPSHVYQGFKLRPGRPYPFGATLVPGGVNFSIFSGHARFCTLVLFKKGAPQPFAEIPFRGLFQNPDTGEPLWGDFRIGNVFTMTVFDLDDENIEYGFRMDGPLPRPVRGQPAVHRFDPSVILMDPYAKAIAGREVWGELPNWEDIYPHRSRLVFDDFDWESDRPLETDIEDLVIYEMHTRGFTRHPSSHVRHPGTFAAIREKIPYLKQLGVNCIELMPIFEFDEFEGSRLHPETGEQLMNYWGYSTIGFFAPKAAYAATGRSHDSTMVVDELKTVVKELHKNGIEIILDIVVNHTAEGNEYGPTICFRGIDNATYYILTPDGYYFNFSGTGNTLNCNNPIVRNLLLDCLRYWASEYHIDGFRFDLAAILGRAPDGAPLPNPPLLETLAYDPILAKCKLIAEAWDAGGLYQVGSFPAFGRWAEWNGKYRDTLRRFIRSDEGITGEVATRMLGSPDLYRERGPAASINFVTCHDGFTLMDMVSYNGKHNEANGEYNNDGANDNNSWNSGWEGPTEDAGLIAFRRKQVKNAAAMLMLSQGIPMILMGDEVGRTQNGNNNAYCHDNEINWLDWSLTTKNDELLRFFSHMIAFRHAHPALRNRHHLQGRDERNTGYPDISWHGLQAWRPQWQGLTLAWMINGQYVKEGSQPDSFIYAALNMHWEDHSFELPQLPEGIRWHVAVNTSMPCPEDIWETGQEPLLSDPGSFLVGARSVVVLVGKEAALPATPLRPDESDTTTGTPPIKPISE